MRRMIVIVLAGVLAAGAGLFGWKQMAPLDVSVAGIEKNLEVRVFGLGTVIRPLARSTSAHLSDNTSEGQRNPANRARATAVSAVRAMARPSLSALTSGSSASPSAGPM